jgi:DNA end-binding protein Ku
MAGRAYWTGYLKLSLVSCQVKLYSATSASAGKISFNLLHKKTLNRVSMKYHDPELGEIAREDLVKGYQFEKDRYVVVTPEELDSIEVESSKTIDIEGFVDAGEIDRLYFDSPYYLAPEGPIAQETYKVILEAMKAAKKVALARVVLSGRERLVAIEPQENGFLVSTIRSAKEIRKASEYLEPIKAKVATDMLAMAKQIIASKAIKFDPDAFEDRYEQALLAMVQSKISGGQPVISKAPERGNVINLMDALKASLDSERRPPAPSLAKRAKAGAGAKKTTAAAPKGAKPAAKKKSSGS